MSALGHYAKEIIKLFQNLIIERYVVFDKIFPTLVINKLCLRQF